MHKLKGVAKRTEQGGFEVYLDGEYLSPKASQKVFNHSPDGFSWGYSGSGPAQLALAVCLKLLARDSAVAYYQRFKNEVISSLPTGKDFEIEFDLPLNEEVHEEDKHTDRDLHPPHPDNR